MKKVDLDGWAVQISWNHNGVRHSDQNCGPIALYNVEKILKKWNDMKKSCRKCREYFVKGYPFFQDGNFLLS